MKPSRSLLVFPVLTFVGSVVSAACSSSSTPGTDVTDGGHKGGDSSSAGHDGGGACLPLNADCDDAPDNCCAPDGGGMVVCVARYLSPSKGCLYQPTSPCSFDSECTTATCVEGTCQISTPGGACTADTDCSSKDGAATCIKGACEATGQSDGGADAH